MLSLMKHLASEKDAIFILMTSTNEMQSKYWLLNILSQSKDLVLGLLTMHSTALVNPIKSQVT